MSDPSEWMRRRSVVNHQWLANDLLINLASYQDEPTSEQVGAIARKRAAWNEVAQEIRELLDELEVAMSPRQLFDRGILRSLPAEYRLVSGDCCHAKWLRQENIEAKRTEILALVDEIARGFQGDAAQETSGVPMRFAGLLDQLSCLSKCLSNLPNRVMLP